MKGYGGADPALRGSAGRGVEHLVAGRGESALQRSAQDGLFPYGAEDEPGPGRGQLDQLALDELPQRFAACDDQIAGENQEFGVENRHQRGETGRHRGGEDLKEAAVRSSVGPRGLGDQRARHLEVRTAADGRDAQLPGQPGQCLGAA